MIVTIDTNILVSATFWKGDSSKIIEMVEKKEIELVLSKDILEEFANVLNYKEIKEKIIDKNLEMKISIEKVTSLSKIVKPIVKFNIIKSDPDDNKILECAKAGNVNFIITNDNHLLKLREFEGIIIITPSEFIKNKLI